MGGQDTAAGRRVEEIADAPRTALLVVLLVHGDQEGVVSPEPDDHGGLPEEPAQVRGVLPELLQPPAPNEFSRQPLVAQQHLLFFLQLKENRPQGVPPGGIEEPLKAWEDYSLQVGGARLVQSDMERKLVHVRGE